MTNSLVQTVRTLASSPLLGERHVFVFSAAVASRSLVADLKRLGIQPSTIIDNNPDKHGTLFEGVPISPPDTLCKYDTTNSVLLVASHSLAEAVIQMRALGYQGNIVRMVSEPANTSY